ncbi:pyridoxal phosphate-dependent transferase [Melanogaster broomeanus]|nr:pyridoxal phosphate-dependent transferase [Melanogaster broomeanus]
MGGLDIDKVRASFPSLRDGYIYADNAGGSQTAQQVIDNIVDYLSNTNVQLDGSVAAALLFNAASVDEVGYGHSATMVLENIARAMENDIKSGDEFIITEEHEANNGPWKRLAQRRGAVVKYWKTVPTSEDNPYSLSYRTEDLLSLISSKTRLLAITGCSNILGTIIPVDEIVRAVRQRAKEVGAPKVEFSVDCVAYAPHRRIDVQKWDIDYCVFSLYKVYGTHNAGFYVRTQALQASLSSIAHHFLAADDNPTKVQPGGPGYELVVPYLLSLTPENSLEASFDAIAQHERLLVQPLLSFLADKKQAPTISFVVIGQNAMKSKDIVAAFDKEGNIGIRYGHFYAYSLIANATPKLDPADGVVRISLVHYNTVEEVEKIVSLLTNVLEQ